MPRKYDYDAIIIGAGISGLVCGCYLAKAGMKTLIVEKNSKPGGYCTSFRRGGFHFDACVQSLSSLREGGNIKTVLHELGIDKRLHVQRYNPSDIVMTPDRTIHFWNNLDETVHEFQAQFPEEAGNIKCFFEYINSIEGMSFGSLTTITFQVLLDSYFQDGKLKALLSFLLLGSCGLPAHKISAFTGVVVYKEFLLDGGYYPHDSIQSFPDLLMDRFKEYGGDIVLSCRAKQIHVRTNKVKSVELMRGDNISAEFIISNVDTTQAFLSLIGPECVSEETMNVLTNAEPSLSSFILYLGMDGKLTDVPLDSLISWLPDYDIEKIYNSTINGSVDNVDWFTARVSSIKKRILMHVNVPYYNEKYWEKHKKRLIDVFIEKMEHVIPDLARHVVYKDAATPLTLHKWTLNSRGAAFGWAWTPSQFAIKGLTQTTSIHNFYQTGHWTTLAQGVSGVTYLGRRVAKSIVAKKKDTRTQV
jgi:phytoene dehydrogenase-like protein